MNHVSSFSHRTFFAAALIALAASVSTACKSTDSSAEPAPRTAGRVDLSNDLTANATVTALVPEQRLITLRRVDVATSSSPRTWSTSCRPRNRAPE